MLLEIFTYEPLSIHTYLIGSKGEAAVIDPTRDITPILDFLEKKQLKLSFILETHIHADFASGAGVLAEATNAVIIASGKDMNGVIVDYNNRNIKRAIDDTSFFLGDLEIRCFLTPGHTPEHMSYLVTDLNRGETSTQKPSLFFCGDFLFVNSFGRPDILGEDYQQLLAEKLYDTIYSDKFQSLDDELILLPTHGGGSLCGKAIDETPFSTLGQERRASPIFKYRDKKEEFVRFVLKGQPPLPKYFPQLKRKNQRGATPLKELCLTSISELPLADFADKVFDTQNKKARDQIQILDIRQPPAYAGGHIPGSYSVWYHKNTATWVGYVLNYSDPIYIICDCPHELVDVVLQLKMIGYDNIAGALKGGFGSWQASGLPIETLATTDVRGLHAKLEENEGTKKTIVIDVRTQPEYDRGHIDRATHIELSKLADNVKDLDKEKHYALVCGGGYRASLASSIMLREGFSNVENVLGGMRAWQAMSLPLGSKIN